MKTKRGRGPKNLTDELRNTVFKIESDLPTMGIMKSLEKHGMSSSTYYSRRRQLQSELKNNSKISNKENVEKQDVKGVTLHFKDFDFQIKDFKNIRFEDATVTIKGDCVEFKGSGRLERD